MVQLFDQRMQADPAPPSRRVDMRLELDRLFATPDDDAVDLSPFFTLPPTKRRRAPRQRPRPAAWLRTKAPGLLLLVAGALLGIAVTRL